MAAGVLRYLRQFGASFSNDEDATHLTFPGWTIGVALWPVSLTRALPVPLVGLLVFSAYWGLPGALATLEGTLLSQQDISASMSVSSVLLNGLQSAPQLASGLSYLSDRSHLLFATALALGGPVAVTALRRIGPVVGELQRHGPLTAAYPDVLMLHKKYRAVANHWIGRVISFLLAILTGVVFLHFWLDPELVFWWGSSKYGIAGLVFSFVELIMVYYGTQGLFLVSIASIMFYKLLKGGITLRPFHPDGCNGLFPLGKLIVILWILALLIAISLYVALFLGYLGIEEMKISWILAIIATIALPLVAIIPLYASLSAIQKARSTALGKLEPLLNQAFSEAHTAAERGDYKDSFALVQRLNELRGAHELVFSVNIWPFNPKTLVVVTIAYLIQLALTVRELLTLY